MANPLFAAEDNATKGVASFDMAWQTIREAYFDQTFGGIDWDESGRRYREEIASSEGVEAFVRISNRMLFELRVSHLLVATPGELQRSMPRLLASGVVGIDVRWMQKVALVTAVRTGFPAWSAGIRPGFLITEIDGRRVEEIIAGAQMVPPYNERNRRGGLSNYILGHIDGPAGTSVRLTWLNAEERSMEAVVTRRSRGTGTVLDEAIPPAYVEFKLRRLEGDIGYVWFNHFAGPVETTFAVALDAMGDTKGLIIDLRGNPGGYFSVVDAIASRLLPPDVVLYRFQYRNETIERASAGTMDVYRQPVVVLVDVTTTSASELFAAIMQATGRAVVIGEHSPGYLLAARWMKLPNGVSFMYPFTEPIPANGDRVEDAGCQARTHAAPQGVAIPVSGTCPAA